MHLLDIEQSIGLIRSFLEGVDFASYKKDQKTKSAVERQLQILTEAAFRLGDDAEILCPGVDWRQVRGMGNFLRHSYQSVEDEVIWTTVTRDIPPLAEAVRKALEGLNKPS
jgi:uncharacterized protein with HEPN domain